MDPRNDESFDREPWRRLLDAEASGPPRDVDRRILAAARRALAPRIARWWLPASLAASLLLAVLIVQLQLEDGKDPGVMTESDVLPAPADEPQREAPAEPPPAADMPAPAMELPTAKSRPLADIVPSRAAPPQAAPRSGQQPPGAEQPADAAASPVESASRLGKFRTQRESAAQSRTPEDWYAEIEALRAAGRIEEADAELTRLEAAYPGWVERHHQENR